MQPQRPSVCCWAHCSPAAFQQTWETARAPYQTDHTRLRAQHAGQRASHGHGYSWRVSGEKKSGEKCRQAKEEMKGPSNAERAVDYVHAYIERIRGKREKKKEMNMDIKC